MKDPQSIDAPRPGRNPEGKSLHNAYPVYLRGEEEAYEKHLRTTLDLLAPVGGYELHLAQSVADNQWRLQRARSIEATLSVIHPEAERSFRLLKQYQRNIQRGCKSDMAQLKTVQARRKKARQEAIKEAMNRPTSCIN